MKGQRRCVVVVPKEAAPGNPWSWRGCYWDHEPQTEVELLKRGFHVAFITPDPGKPWDAWYAFLTEKHGLSKKPAFIGMSRGGVNAYAWATANPDKVSCIYADNPAIRPDSLHEARRAGQERRAPAARLRQPRFVLGKHTLVIENIYHQLGGRITVMIKEGAAHHPAQPARSQADRGLHRAERSAGRRRSARLRRQDVHEVLLLQRRELVPRLPEGKDLRRLPRAGFTECYDRYDVSTTASVGITGWRSSCRRPRPRASPGCSGRTSSAGMRWSIWPCWPRGFTSSSAPSRPTSGPVREQWNAVYKHLTDHGFSKKPVMEGAGTAAGEAYAWAIENPDKVSCIYGENPVLRSLMSKTPPLDNLAPLAKAGVPLLHVCGSLDPWLNDQTRVVEKRYKELGGQITVIVKEGEGHYPLAPKDPKSVVDLITGIVF